MKHRWILLLAVAGEIVGSGLMESFKPGIAGAQNLNCQKAQTQSELNQCADLIARDADQKLNQVYQQLRKNRGTELDTLLVESEKAWIKYRDASCAFSRKRVAGGSIAPMVSSNCIARLTEQRTQELEGYLKEGNF